MFASLLNLELERLGYRDVKQKADACGLKYEVMRQMLKGKHPSDERIVEICERLKLEIVEDWANGWHNDQMQLIRRIEQAIKSSDYDQLCIATGQLKAVTTKRFEGLNSIIDNLKLPE